MASEVDAHAFDPDHVHAQLVKNPVAQGEPYRAAMQTIRGALAYALNQVDYANMPERNAVEALFLQMREYSPEHAPQRVPSSFIPNSEIWR